MDIAYRCPGTAVALTGSFGNRVWHAVAATVVSDSDDGAILLVTPGNQYGSSEFYHERRVRGDSPPGARSLFWDAVSGEFECYYVNFQRPFHRTRAGYDALDLDLDIIVEPDLQWRWKDEDDWAAATISGVLSEQDIHGVELAKSEILHRIDEDRLQGFSRWVDWEPASDWPTAQLPEGWESARVP